MRQKERAQEVLKRLRTQYPSFITALDWEKPWHLLVAVMLSAQTTDENVNKVTKKLFQKYSHAKDIARATIKELEKDIYSTGYYKAKAKNLKALSTELAQRNERVPDDMEELITLPGVGRKTANVVLHVLYGKTEGIVMDTHIARVTQRIGFTKEKNPPLAEKKMMRVLPKTDWKEWGDLLIQHGRKICDARKPLCEQCVLNDICPTGKKIIPL